MMLLSSARPRGMTPALAAIAGVLILSAMAGAQTPLTAEELEGIRARIEAAEQAQRRQHAASTLRKLWGAADDTEAMVLLRSLTELGPDEVGRDRWLSLASHPREPVRIAVLRILGELDVEEVLPELLRWLEEPTSSAELRAAAARALGKIGRADATALEVLKNCLASTFLPYGVRRDALDAVASRGRNARALAGVVARYADDPFLEIRHRAYVALGEIAGEPTYAVFRGWRRARTPVSESAVAGSGFEVPGDAATAPACELLSVLRTVGTTSPSLLAFAFRALESPDPYAAQLAEFALSAIESPAPELWPELRRQLLEGGEPASTIAAACLATLDGGVSDLVDPLIERLRRFSAATDSREVLAIVDLLRAAGPKAQRAALALTELLAPAAPFLRDRPKHEITDLKARVLVTLAELDAGPPVLPAVVEALENDDEPLVLVAAARAARSRGLDQRALEPFLRRFLASDFLDRSVNVGALGRLHEVQTFAPTTVAREVLATLLSFEALTAATLEVLAESLKQSSPKDAWSDAWRTELESAWPKLRRLAGSSR